MALSSPGAQFLRQQAESAISNFYSVQDGSDIGIPKRVHPNDLIEFKDHTFKIRDDADMDSLIKSIEAEGVREPLLVFYNEDKDLEIIAGHRRRYAAQKLGIESIPVLIMKITREDATFLMCETNMKKRTVLLPSEEANSYKVMIEAMGRTHGQRTDKTGEEKGKTTEILAKKIGVSRGRIEEYLCLNNLMPEILELVDQNKLKRNTGMAVKPAVQISYLPENFQEVILKIYQTEEKSPSHKQARQMKQLFDDKQLDEQRIQEIMEELKPNQKRSEGVEITNPILLQIKKNKGLADEAFQQLLVKALDFYQKHGQTQVTESASTSNRTHL